MKNSRRISSLEQDIRHTYVEMKSLLQAEEKVKEVGWNCSHFMRKSILGAGQGRKVS
jgi:hypothetical protein